MPGRFKDFIAMPKVNMYQSLHTTVIGPKGDPVEIQIRTPGHAPHRRGGHRRPLALQGEEGRQGPHRRLAACGCASSWRPSRTRKDPGEFLDSVRVDLFPDEVYVFTPKGDVKALPEGATPIDFAYAVHTKVGEHCVGAKVNGKLVPLRYTLRQGDIVEIVTSPNQHPSRDWLKIVKSSRARSKINQWLKVEERARSHRAGPRDVRARGQEVPAEPGRAARRRRDEAGRRRPRLPGAPTTCWPPSATARPRCTSCSTSWRPAATLEPVERAEAGGRPPGPSTDQGVRIRGVEDLLVRFAKCCNPLPGDAIVGFITRGRGLTVHARDCLTVAKSVLDRERLIDVEWDVEEPAKRPVRIAVYIGNDRPGLLSEITGAISSRNGNITKAEVTVTDDRRGINNFVVEVADLRQLQDIMSAIREVADVINVERVRGL